MTWNYRLVQYTEAEGGGYGIHEVYYDEAGSPTGMTERAVGPVGDTPDEVVRDLTRMQNAVQVYPVFVPPAEWSGGADAPSPDGTALETLAGQGLDSPGQLANKGKSQ